MIFYPAGNFPQMKKIEEERKLRDMMRKAGHEYNRLISFHYKKDSETILKLKEEELNADNKDNTPEDVGIDKTSTDKEGCSRGDGSVHIHRRKRSYLQ
jgi:hypothetical protein